MHKHITLFLAALFYIFFLASCTTTPDTKIPTPPSAPLVPVSFGEIEGWLEDEHSKVLGAFEKSCISLRWEPHWSEICSDVKDLDGRPETEVRAFFEERFTPYELRDPDGDTVGLATGYYVPDLKGSRQQSWEYPYPLYRRPDDLLVIDLSDAYPELGKYRLRGRLEGDRVIPYWDREAIDGELNPLEGNELFWVADPVELFFLHIQGSGRIIFEDGSRSMVNYAGQNGHPYRSISNWLIKKDIMTRDEMSMENIKTWARDNPSQVDELLNNNPSYIFFSPAPGDPETPPGALGVPLTPERSVAVDRRYTPLGAPVFISTTWPNTDQPLNRLMMAQDTGGAIKGPVRADFFWGMGDEAGNQAGKMKQALRMWVLLPKQ